VTEPSSVLFEEGKILREVLEENITCG